MRVMLAAVAGAILLFPVLSQARKVADADADAIRAVIERQRDAWNRHDMDAYVAEMTPDVDWVNIVGMHWEGRETVRKAHAALHGGIFAHSRSLPPESLELREIAPGVVVAVKISRIEGAGPTPDGAPYPDGGNILTLVFVKTETGWRIAHAHNTPINRQAVAHDPAKPQ
jgi:uncharacterized protein (TIGR02246 family)